jgi:hypothetical protein
VGSVFGPVRFLLPVCRISWFLYTLNIYAHFSSHFSQQLLMTQIWYLVTSFISVPHIVGSAFGPIRFIFLVCRLCWFLYTLNIYAHFIVAFFSANIDGRNLIFGHKLHIGTLFCGSIFWPVRFLLPVCRLSWLLYTFNIYAHFSSHFSQQLLMTGIWYLVTSFISVPHIVGSVFWTHQIHTSCLPTVDFYTHWTYMLILSSHFSQQIMMAEIWYFVILHIGIPFCGKHFLTRQIPTSCLPTKLAFIHI